MTAVGELEITVLVMADRRRKPVFLAELARSDRYRPVGLVSSVAAAAAATQDRRADVILVDVTSLERLADVAALRDILDEPRVILVSELPTELALLAGLAAGAKGFVEKPVEEGMLDQAVSAVAAGHTFVDPRCARWLVDVALHGMNARTDHRLSLRQAQVLRLASTGLTNREIGHIMHLSAETVKSHLREAMRRLGVHNRLGAAALIEAPLED